MHNTPPRMRKAEQHVAGYLLRKLPTIRDTKCPCSRQPSPIQNAKQLLITAIDGPEALISHKAHAKKEILEGLLLGIDKPKQWQPFGTRAKQTLATIMSGKAVLGKKSGKKPAKGCSPPPTTYVLQLVCDSTIYPAYIRRSFTSSK